MANDFFDSGDYTALVAHTLARGSSVNAIFAAVAVGFDRLPAKLLLDQGRVTYGTEQGGSAANVYVFNLPQTLASYVEGLEVVIKTAHVNTGPSTINIDGRGAKTIKTGGGSALVGGELLAGAPVKLVYDGTDFRIMTGAASLTDLATHAALTAAHGATGAVVGTTNTQTLTNKTLTSPTLSGTTVLPGSGAISSGGLLGLGMTPTNILDITQTQNAASIAKLLNANAGGAASSDFVLANGTSQLGLQHLGTGFTTAGLSVANRSMITASGAAGIAIQTAGAAIPIIMGPNGTEIARFISAGLGIGMTPSEMLDITKVQNAATIAQITNTDTGASAACQWKVNVSTAVGGLRAFGANFSDGNALNVANSTQVYSSGHLILKSTLASGAVIFGTNDATEVARIVPTNDGTLLVGRTAAVGTYKVQVENPDAAEGAIFATCSNAAPGASEVGRLAFSASPDNNTAVFLRCVDGTTSRVIIYADGDLQNHDNSYGAISDEKLKQDITDYDAAAQWEDFKAIRLRQYRAISDVDAKGESAKVQLGVIAQELAAIMPGLVRDYPDTEEVELEPARVEIQKVERPKTETVTVETEEFTEVDGKLVLSIVQRQEQRPVMEEVRPAKPEVRDPRTGAVVQPAEPAVMRPRVILRPVIEEVDEEVVIPAKLGTQLTGTSTKGVLYSVLNLKTIAIVQELMRRVEALEAKVGI